MFRFIAGCCLLALLCTHWASAPHVHENSHHPHQTSGDSALIDIAAGATGFSLSSDDAHEEHSAVAEITDANCAFCRSNERNEEARPARIEQAFNPTQRLTAYTDPADERTSALFARLRPARAPPIHWFA